MKKILLLLIAFCFTLGYSQNRKGQFYITSENAPHILYVSFGLNVNWNSENYTDELKNRSAEFRQIANQYQLQLEKGIPISEEKLQEMQANAFRISGTDAAVKRLRGIFKVEVPNANNAKLMEIAAQLEQLSLVDYCSLESLEPVRPPSDIPPVTPNYEGNQGYIQSNPGVNMQYAWDLGLNGQGIRLRDVEYGFNKNHEELSDVATSIAPGMNVSSSAYADYTEHGTGVFGIMYAHKGTYGISGLAHGASELLLFPEWQQSGYSRINAVSQSVASSTAGDVIVYEMQMDGPGSGSDDLVLAEYNQVVWDLTLAGTDAGVVIVAAAGNGNVDLDGSLYDTYMNRGDSGAIIVGAGTSTTSHERLYYSTYGARVDLQAWGQNVQSIGRITGLSYFMVGNDFNQSYITFTGTSSATPIVASCAAVLQSYYHTLTNNYLTSAELRVIMQNTGIAQGLNVFGNIGPIPNMQPAIQAVYDLSLGMEEFSATRFYVYPNPVTNQLTVVTGDAVLPSAKVEISNGLGQIVISTELNAEKIIDVSDLSSGFYFVTISQNNSSFTQKILKN